MEILQTITLILLIISSIILIVAILLLPPKESSMGTAIGGGEELNLFGKKKSRGAIAVLERTVISSAAVFMLAAFIYNFLIKFVS